MTICPRCAKNRASIHTCTPTEYARGMEAENAALKQRNQYLEQWALESEGPLHKLNLDLTAQLTASRAEAARCACALSSIEASLVLTSVVHPNYTEPWLREIRQALDSSTATQWLQENYAPKAEALQAQASEARMGEALQGLLDALSRNTIFSGAGHWEVARVAVDRSTALAWLADGFIPRTEVEAMQREWQPIETAPKDGFRILLYREGWQEDRATGWWWADGKCWVMVGGTPFNNATHWMPLPSPPASKETEP